MTGPREPASGEHRGALRHVASPCADGRPLRTSRCRRCGRRRQCRRARSAARRGDDDRSFHTRRRACAPATARAIRGVGDRERLLAHDGVEAAVGDGLATVRGRRWLARRERSAPQRRRGRRAPEKGRNSEHGRGASRYGLTRERQPAPGGGLHGTPRRCATPGPTTVSRVRDVRHTRRTRRTPTHGSHTMRQFTTRAATLALAALRSRGIGSQRGGCHRTTPTSPAGHRTRRHDQRRRRERSPARPRRRRHPERPGRERLDLGRGRQRHRLGGDGNDRIFGAAGDDKLSGRRATTRPGRHRNDLLDLGDGNDWASGGTGDDTISGGAGNDRSTRTPGPDTVSGGDGNDDLWAMARVDATTDGSATVDRLDGGAGDDRFHARDGEADVITCATARTSQSCDSADVISDATTENANGSCETVKRAGIRRRRTRANRVAPTPRRRFSERER